MPITAKVTADYLPKLLKDLGVDVVVVEDEADIEYDEKAIYEAIDANRALILEPKISEKVKSEIAGVSGSKLRRKLVQTTGVSRKVLDEIQDDDEAIKTALKFYEDKFSGDAQEMNRKFVELSESYEAERQAFENRVKEVESQWKHKYNSRNIVDEIETQYLSKIKLPKEANRKFLAKQFYDQLSQQYDLDFDETENKTIVRQKGKEFIAQNKQGTKPFDWKEAADDFIKPFGYPTSDTRDIDPAEEMNRRRQQPGGGTYRLPGSEHPGGGNGGAANQGRTPQERAEAILNKNLKKAEQAQ